MKRLIVIFLIFFYIMPAIGFSLNLHWCGGNINLVEINALHKSKCSCGIDMPSGCCKDVELNLKISDSHKSYSYSTAPSASFFNLINHQFHIDTFKPIDENIFQISFYYPPPFKYKCGLYKEFNVFRI